MLKTATRHPHRASDLVREEADTLRVYYCLVSRQACDEPLRVPMCVFERSFVRGFFKARRIAQVFYGQRVIRFIP